MAKQALLWTALPNGYTHDRKWVRVSLLLSPRLHAEAAPPRLSSFPDFVDWPQTLSDTKFRIRFGNKSVIISGLDTTGASRVDNRLGTPESNIWKALFPDPDKTFVEGYKFRDLSNDLVLSFPAASIDALVRDLYSGLASKAGDQLPTAATILDDPAWSDLVDVVSRNDQNEQFVDHKNGVRDPKGQFKFFSQGKHKQFSDLARNLFLFQLFHTPPSRARVDKYNVPAGDPRERARWLGYERTALPKAADFQNQIDFHKVVAAMSQYPTLLRLLGLVVDFLIPADAFDAAPNALLRAEVTLPPGTPNVKRSPDVSPRTRALLNSTQFQALPRPNPAPGDYQTVDGLLNLDPKVFELLQADVDGGGLKVTNFARTLARLRNVPERQIDPTSKHERDVGAPALRNAGLMLVHGNRGAMLKNSFDRQKKYNEAAEKIQSGVAQQPPEVFAEDLVRGWRIDIWDNVSKVWHSLCRRVANYDLREGAVVVNVREEEGTVRLAATKTPDPANNPNLIWLHEALVAWTGWSLCAPAPGRTIHHDDTDHTDPVGDAEAEVPPGLHLKSAFKALPGSLPRLRYGRNYWLRARVVDLAGNSLPFKDGDFGPEKPAQRARPYLRFDPVSAPALALVKPTPDRVEAPAEGESMERIAIRTFNDKPADNTVRSQEQARRFGVPSRTTHREAEQHGMLDRNGIVEPEFFAMLAAKDNSLAEEKILTAGPLVESPPVETRYAALLDGDALPYLPEPLAVTIAARIFDLPGHSPDKIIEIPLYEVNTNWPDALPFKIELYEKPGDKPRFDKDKRTLFIPLPKALRATLRLSVKPTPEALNLLGVWNWLTPPQRGSMRTIAGDGQHWMLTPWRNIELVHAVQKPLITPEIVKHDIDRMPASTYALPNFVTTCSIKSTSHLDILAKWNEPVEDVQKNSGENRERRDHAFTVKITEEKDYAGTPDYKLEGKDLVRAGGFFNDKIPKKIHEFHDTRYRRINYWFDATTAFREFMPGHLLTAEISGHVVPTDEHIKVTGPTLRTWIPSSAPPPAPDVLYVVPTFGWVRTKDDGNKSSWRRGGGLRVYLNRPWNVTGYGEMLAVVLPAASFKDDPNTAPPPQPLKNFVTQWGNDPIWLSSFVSSASPKRSDFPLARTAADPTGRWLPSFAPAEEADQPPSAFTVTGLPHPDLVSGVPPQAFVEIAPHDVYYDEERQLWYCDIEVDWGAAYYPFIRLALARYQPVSVSGAHLSNIVLADFMALVPDRWLNVTRTKEVRTHRVSVYGSTFRDSSSHTEAESAPGMSLILAQGKTETLQAPEVSPTSVIEVWVERFQAALGEDFGWKRESGAVVQQDGKLLKGKLAVAATKATVSSEAALARQRARAKELVQQREFEVLVKESLVGHVFAIPPLWEGSVTLPQAPGGSARYRLAIAEYEEYLVDDPRPYDPVPTQKDRRLVFIEYVELG
jgi:hypothetical protein